ncbi:MAG: hypothetical protein GX448_18920 [Planctomycetes bacterium]|nr:hypothetical protein [Planctomycetota bacterium]
MKESSGHIAAGRPRGSALILTVVLTSLLAIVGVLFVMATRIDKMATTAATESRELTCAIDTVVAQIGQALADDVPGVTKSQEYYDYPDDANPWLADLEPYESGGKYYWRQISNFGVLTSGVRNILINKIIGERDAIVNPGKVADPDALADADGDGVADAKWFQVPDVMTSKGKRFYAAVRVIDNGGMLNLNTGFRFDPTDSTDSGVEMTSPLRVNVLSLAAGPAAAPSVQDEETLLGVRANGATGSSAALNLPAYERSVIWQYLDVKNPSDYTPFDMSDELELRNRYVVDQTEIDTRAETCGRFTGMSVPLSRDLDKWYPRVTRGNNFSSYAYRHIATTYNMDRILAPEPTDSSLAMPLGKMVNVNTADVQTLRKAVVAALLDSQPNLNHEMAAQEAAQISANLIDYIDDDDEVTVINELSSAYYGFERPCVYISEIACRLVEDSTGKHWSYAVELFKPYFEDKDPKADEWQLVIDRPNTNADPRLSLVWSGSRRFHVVLADDPRATLSGYVTFTDANEPADSMPLYAYNRADYARQVQTTSPDNFQFEAGATISLERNVPGASRPLTVDMIRVPEGWMPTASGAYSIRRDIQPYRSVRRLWASAAERSTPTLGNDVGPYVDRQRPGLIQAHPANRPLTNIGELGKIFRQNGYVMIPEGQLATAVLINLVDPNNAGLFRYLTVIDPANKPRVANSETRIMGRININTAPAFVLAQLPWMSYKGVAAAGTAGSVTGTGATNSSSNPVFDLQTAYGRGEEIVKYRDAHGAYRSTAGLMQVPALYALASDLGGNGHNDTPRGPDLTPDTALNDLEERDLLFTRLSDLVTVRSDVFTAYILIRIGESGPQKRLIAIFDRSRVNSPGDKVRLVALHPVPDPR